MKVLLVEDEPSIASVVNKGLTENGYSITIAPDGIVGFQLAAANEFDVLMIDIMLPGMNGMELCKRLREHGVYTPVLFLTALSTTENIVAGLNAGGDDYLVKPFKFAELEARLRSLHRRKQITLKEEDVFHISDIVIDFNAKTVTQHNEPVSLTSTEFRLLEYFVRNKNKVLSRIEILEKVWGIDFNMGTNVVDVYVNYLRKKIDKRPDQKLIHTVIGMGYMLKTT
ncbi:response regulator transcription factor [Panacibacter sp. DH6]|uniref:Response regulator transcription factor n=1 Tax=Panacibacter microcysteis TaxID=2793269 RepID=A0A931GXW1_9BACT|nr:response regulator transcription factor [Panacibacter microcysteis]MBG9376739.1 response regulator transcription factor [Panacibacter microcysteis]